MHKRRRGFSSRSSQHLDTDIIRVLHLWMILILKRRSPHVACREIIDANVTRAKRGDRDTASVISSASDPALFLEIIRLLQMIYSRTLSGSSSSPAHLFDTAAPTRWQVCQQTNHIGSRGGGAGRENGKRKKGASLWCTWVTVTEISVCLPSVICLSAPSRHELVIVQCGIE